MDIQGVGSGPLDQGLSSIARGVSLPKDPAALSASLAQIGADTVAGFLKELSPVHIAALLNIVAPELAPHRIAQLDSLVLDVRNAATAADVKEALAKLLTVASLDPSRAVALASDPALAPIGKEVEALLARLTTAAHLDAQAWFQEAGQIRQASASPADLPRNRDAATLLLLAGRLIEGGGFANWVLSAEISAMIIENGSPAPPIATQTEKLLGTAVDALREGNVSDALAKLAAVASLDPRRAESLAFEPALAQIAKEVTALLARLSTGALRDAETRLQAARQFVQAPSAPDDPVEAAKPSSHLQLAASLIAAGGYVNYVRSATVSGMVLDESRWAPAQIAAPLPGRDGARIRRQGAATGIRRWMTFAFLKNLWRRAPLLLLLTGWLAGGVAGGSVVTLLRSDLPPSTVSWFFEIWALGFLALVGFGFYIRLRNR